jgi:hypothetical protein
MNVGRSPIDGPPNRSDSPEPLPLRWALILAIAAAIGLLAGQAEGLVPGILAAGGTAVALNVLVGDIPGDAS